MNQFTSSDIILAGLGGAGTGVGTSMNKEMGASIIRMQFLERVHMLPEHIQQALLNGKAQISDSPYYSTATIQGTRAELIKLSTSEQLGVTNIDNGKLNKDRFLVLSGFRLLYDASSIDGKFIDNFPPELLNGEWEVELNGKKVFEKQPIRKFFDGFFGYDVQLPFGTRLVDNPKIIEPQTPIEFNVSLPAALTGFLKVEIIGTCVYGY